MFGLNSKRRSSSSLESIEYNLKFNCIQNHWKRQAKKNSIDSHSFDCFPQFFFFLFLSFSFSLDFHFTTVPHIYFRCFSFISGIGQWCSHTTHSWRTSSIDRHLSLDKLFSFRQFSLRIIQTASKHIAKHCHISIWSIAVCSTNCNQDEKYCPFCHLLHSQIWTYYLINIFRWL